MNKRFWVLLLVSIVVHGFMLFSCSARAQNNNPADARNWAWGRVGSGSSSLQYITNGASGETEFIRNGERVSMSPRAIQNFRTAGTTTAGSGGAVVMERARVATLPSSVVTKPISIPYLEKLTLPKPTVAMGGRVLARALPLVAIGSAIYDELRTKKIDYEDDAWRIEVDLAEPLPPGHLKMSNRTINGTAPYAPDTFGNLGVGLQFPTLPMALAAVDQAVPVGSTCQSTEASYNKWTGDLQVGQNVASGPGGSRETWVTRQCGGGARGSVVYRFAQNDGMCMTGYTLAAGQCVLTEKQLATDQQIEEAIATASTNDLVDVLDKMASNDIGLPSVGEAPHSITPDSSSMVGPVNSSTTTTTHKPDGSTEQKRVERHQEVESEGHGSTVSNSYMTTNVSNITNTYVNNVLTQTDNDRDPTPPTLPLEQPDPPTPSDPTEPVDYSFTDPSMPGLPTLYERKYPNGIAGVWAQKWPQMQATAFMQGIAGMFPTFSGGGSCPSMGLGFNLGFVNFGDHDFGPALSCDLWSILGLILLTTACFTAWKILF